MKQVCANGNVEYRNSKGERHRTDGPAIEWFDGTKEWFISGEPLVTMYNGKVTIWTECKLPKLIKQSIAMEALKV